MKYIVPFLMVGLFFGICFISINPLPFSHLVNIMIRALAVIVLFFLFLKMFVNQVIRKESMNPKVKNIMTIGGSIIGLFFLLEIVFNFVPKSHSISISYAAKNWTAYFSQKNDLGFRDAPFESKDLTKKAIVFLGDSFTVGNGIPNPDNRFANLLQNELADCFETYICAKGGWNTKHQFRGLKKHKRKPDYIVYQYSGNDVDGDLPKLEKKLKFELYDDLDIVSKAAVKSSFLLNYIYWIYPHKNLENHIALLLDSFKDEGVIKRHEKSIKKILQYAKNQNIKLYTFVMPNLYDIESSEQLFGEKFAKIVNEFDYDIQHLDFKDQFLKIPFSERIINPNDHHASEKINKIIADELIMQLQDVCEKN